MSAPLKVILAEDNQLQRKILSRMLVRFGYEVLEAEDGQQALDLVLSSDAQIVLSDYDMPKLNGVELTRAIRASDVEHYVHTIMLTGSGEDDVRSEAFEAGVDDFIAKGQSPLLLQTRMRSAARLVQHATALAETNRALRETHNRLETDLRAAADAQRQLLPDIQGQILDYCIASTFVPSAIVSGDMFGCFALTDSKLGFYAVDVSGHGVHASLLSVAIGHLITPEFFRTRALYDERAPDPAALVDELNRRFSGADNDDYFTMFCGIIDSERGQLDYCQAAYPSPQHLSKDGTLRAVGDGGFPVGMLPQATYENGSVAFEHQDALIIFSDAVLEAENTAHEPFGIDRMQGIAKLLPKIGVEKLPDTLAEALDEWRDGRPLEDDLTIVALERM